MTGNIITISGIEKSQKIKIVNKRHCMKSIQIWSYFWSVFSCIQSEYRKTRTRKNSVFGHFSLSVSLMDFVSRTDPTLVHLIYLEHVAADELVLLLYIFFSLNLFISYCFKASNACRASTEGFKDLNIAECLIE